MTQAQIQEQRWRTLFREQHEFLSEVAEILLCQNDSPEQILQTALAELEGRPFCEPFERASAVRAVVKAAIAYDYCHFDMPSNIGNSGPGGDEQPGPLLLKDIPWIERAAFFLCDVLLYSRRDSALLLGISDSTVEQLDRLARKRMMVPVDNPDKSSAPGPNSIFEGRPWQ